jgi:hypothetical protein
MRTAQTGHLPAAALDLPRNEMAFRMRYQELLLARQITTVFRPGDRIYPNWRGYLEGETVIARVIKRTGSDALGIAPQFNDLRLPIRILSLTVKPVDALTAADFLGSSPDVRDVAGLIAHLSEIYGEEIDRVTRIHFRYEV